MTFRYPRLVAGLLLVALAALGYANTLGLGFVWDDQMNVVQNRFLRTAAALPRFFTSAMTEAYRHPPGDLLFYRPVRMLSHFVEYQLWELRPVGYHLTNLVLHTLNALLIWALLGAVRVPNGLRCLLAAVFVVHPLHTEAVAYIASRGTLLVTLFQLLALLGCLRLLAEQRAKWPVTVATGAAFAVALFSKETALTFPLIVLALGWSRRSSWRALAPVVAGLIAVVLVYGVARALVLPTVPTPVAPVWPVRLALILRSLAMATGLMIAPVNLHMERTVAFAGPLGLGLTVTGLLLAVGLAVAGRWFRTHDWRGLFGLFLFSIPFLSVAGVVTLNASFAEAWLYWPMVGAVVAAAAALESSGLWERHCRSVVTVGCAGIAVFLSLTIAQNRVWRDSRTLFETTIARGGDTARANFNLGVVQLNAGEHSAARQSFRRALQLDPCWGLALLGLGWIDFQAQHDAPAERWFELADRLGTGNALPQVWLAAIREQQGDLPAAERLLQAVAVRTDDLPATLELARFYVRHQRWPAAERAARAVLAQDPIYAPAHNLLGEVLQHTGRPAPAVEHFRLAARYDGRLPAARANLSAMQKEMGGT